MKKKLLFEFSGHKIFYPLIYTCLKICLLILLISFYITLRPKLYFMSVTVTFLSFLNKLTVTAFFGSHRYNILTFFMNLNFRYAMFLFTNHHEELVGIYASQFAAHRCINLFLHMMELRLNSR